VVLVNARAAVVVATTMVALAGCGGSSKTESNSTPPPVQSGPSAPASVAPSPSSSADSMANMPGMDHTDTASPSASSTSSSDAIVVHIDLVNGKPSTRPEAILKVKKSQTITIIATADKNYQGTEPYEIHVHGFDIPIYVPPGKTVTKTFTADQPKGTYEVEIENTGSHLFNIQIS
jgi:hypothetical protein